MGRGVLAVNSNASPLLRVYAHCAKERVRALQCLLVFMYNNAFCMFVSEPTLSFQAGVVVLLINLSNQTVFNVDVQSNNNARVQVNKKRSVLHGLKKSVSWIGSKASDEKPPREEYQLTPKNGDLTSTTMLLNAQPLQLTERGGVPDLVPDFVDTNSPLGIAPFSIKFVVHPNFYAPGCK